MTEVSTIGLDLAKAVFQAHGATAEGAVAFRKKLRRDQVLAFFSAQPACVVAMEACASAHHWGRELQKLGHQVRLIAPAYVKPFVKRQKNRLLIIGASGVVRWARRKSTPAGSWLGSMLARKPPMLVMVALANKTARIAWALLSKGGVYQAPLVTA